jgi:hypothetical protein
MIRQLPVQPLFVQIADHRSFTTAFAANAVITVENKLS